MFKVKSLVEISNVLRPYIDKESTSCEYVTGNVMNTYLIIILIK